MKFWFVISALLFSSICTVSGSDLSAAEVPKFRDYSVKVYSGPVSFPDLSSDPDARRYRTRLRSAAKAPVNFAGEFILTSWGCGTTCVDGAVLNAKTGQVIFLPHTVCCWENVDDGFRPIEFRSDSHLIVFAGLRNEEEPMGAHFYDFSHGKFSFIKTIATTTDFR